MATTLTEDDLMELVSLSWKAGREGSLSYALENWPWRFTDPVLAAAVRAADAGRVARAIEDHREAIEAWQASHKADGADLINAHSWRSSIAAEGLRALNWDQAGILTGMLHLDGAGLPGSGPVLAWLAAGGLLSASGDDWQLTELGERLAREAAALTMWVFRKTSCGCCLVHLASSDPYLGELPAEADAWAAFERVYPGRKASTELEKLPFAQFARQVRSSPRCEHR